MAVHRWEPSGALLPYVSWYWPVWVFAGGLFPPDSATVVRVENGATTTTDGPFAETKEQLGGFWILKCQNLDEALAWAERASAACMGPVEVRPFQDEAAD